MFDKCEKCGQGGLKCKDDYASLNPGYWWKWRNESHKNRYKQFITNLLSTLPALGVDDVRFPHPIPTPYKCPREESCKGGLDSPCDNAYEGPLCAVCSSGFYKQLQTCKQCPSKKWILGQILVVVAVFLTILLGLVWSITKRKAKKDRGRTLIDMFFSKLKIVIGFYQVTYGLLEAFSYIKWPDSLQAIGKYSEILQMNVLQMAPIDCFVSGLRVDAFGSMFAMMAINAVVIGVSGIAYVVRKVIILQKTDIDEEEKASKISQTKEIVYRNLFFILYVTYLSTCTKTANVLPFACRTICRDEKEESCSKYLKADYSVQCQGSRYNHLLILGYISTAYIIALPTASFTALWRQRRTILATAVSGETQNPGSSKETIAGLRFLFENYKRHSWYWELVEMCRKIILTAGLILVGQESRSYIGLAWTIAGMYGMVFAFISPIQDEVENRLMVVSLCVTVVNLGIGAVSRIPAENIPGSIDHFSDAALFKAIVIVANTSVIGLLVVQYAVHLYQYFKKWRKNPQLSFSCCLEVLLPLNDTQEGVSALAEINQLQSGQVKKPAIYATLKNSDADIVIHEMADRVGNDSMEMQDGSECNKKTLKFHQETQTNLLALSKSGRK